jgi:hypothetical protein
MSNPDPDLSFKEKIRSIQFRRGPAAPKNTVHRTDTAWVTETERTDKQGDHMDVNVAMTDPIVMKRGSHVG